MSCLKHTIDLTTAEAILVVFATSVVFEVWLAVTALLGGLLLLFHILAVGNNLTLLLDSNEYRGALHIASSVVLWCADAWVRNERIPLCSLLALKLIQPLFESFEDLLRC